MINYRLSTMLRFLFLPISMLLWTVAILRRFVYRKGWAKVSNFNIPTICVGNLNMGGTGKTPHVEYITKFLAQQYQTAILSLGYGRKTKGYINAHESQNLSSKMIGDEPMQYITKFPNVEVAVCKKREIGIEKLLQKNQKLDVVILDDAYQYLAVNYSLRILLTDYHSPFFDDFLFPTGTLREPRNMYQYADIIIVTKCPDTLSSEEKANFLHKLKPKQHQDVYFTKIGYTVCGERCFDFAQQPMSVSGENSNILLITGIANPEPLVKYLEALYGKIHHLRFRDHHSFTKRDIEKIIHLKEKMGGENCAVFTTEKDAVRLQVFENMPYYSSILINIVFLENETAFKEKLLSLLSQKQCVN